MAYSDLKVAELKNLIKDRGIASTGLKLKQQFVDALVADDDAKGAAGQTEQDDSAQEPVADSSADAIAQGEPANNEVKDAAPEAEGVVEANDAADDSSSSGNKRKRRSKTPPVDKEGVNKKLKTADSKEEEEQVQVTLPEDVEKDAPIPPENTEPDSEKIAPYGTSDDVMKVDETAAEVRPRTTDNADLAEEHPSAQPAQDLEMQDADAASSSQHPATKALYIRDLVRPIQPNSLRDHLATIAQAPGSNADESLVKAFHLDKLRSHAFVLFAYLPAATRARSALHGKIWPDEPMRRPLFVDFVPDDKVEDWIATELNRADNTRWEVVYSSTGLDTDGPVVAIHQEVDQGSGGARRPSSSSGPSRPAAGAGEGMPNAPSGPRQRQPEMQQTPAVPAPESPVQSKQFETLDQMFQGTQTKPKIYYKPVHKELVDRRWAEFERETSRDWNEADADPSAYAEGELRRYTFEDGEKLVDGGADFGLFGRHPRRGGGPPRGGGRGGFRGGSRGGDFYRGGSGGRLR